MKRDNDYIRELLFEFEADKDWRISGLETLSMSDSERQRIYHIKLLTDAGLATEMSRGIYRLTSQGHDYLDAIRDHGIWAKTKDGAAAVGGVTLGIMKDIAVAYLKQSVAAKLGVTL